MIRRWIDLIYDLFPVYLEPLDVSVPPDMRHLLDKLDGYDRTARRYPKTLKRLSE